MTTELTKRIDEIENAFISCPDCNGQGGLQEGTPDRWEIEPCQLCNMTGKLYSGSRFDELAALARQPLPFHGPEDEPKINTRYFGFYQNRSTFGVSAEYHALNGAWPPIEIHADFLGYITESDLLHLFQQQHQP